VRVYRGLREGAVDECDRDVIQPVFAEDKITCPCRDQTGPLEPLIAVRRGIGQLRELRRDPLEQRVGSGGAGCRSRHIEGSACTLDHLP
jgi:hypothetical protein